MPFKELDQIINYFEQYLNTPIAQKNSWTLNHKLDNLNQENMKIISQQKKQQRSGKSKPKSDRIGRFKPKIIQNKILFKLVICGKSYVKLPEIGATIANLFLLCKNRKESDIFIVTSNKMSLVASMDQGFCAVPITQFTKYDLDDFMLNILENYIIRL